ncbi:type I restriction enzyme HsdR N-terminal domain-containing protein [Halosimplex rubrum]|uniref:Type I restriction enzyme HsdR N-terminal domain-containing protein n=1 Tax=Halosimplex rubrum TaxID=869889 RepID=A0A7D5T5J5_9EURY|nr:type I restriction enzyme HsdR N-terminal domain-containing protein [Halosimplex rubrum]QLH77653.1 type I restriction enzyme HsdR N-terminal domain-containing protein [Halosimplex rubrum]
MDRQDVGEYVDRSQQLIEASPQMDEANTKAAVLRDFLDLLDWEIPINTQLEYSVKAFGQTYKVDYALILEGTPVAFLEAKGADTALTSDHEEQLSSYMMNKNVNYGILSNGKQYRFFQRHVDATNVNVQRVIDTHLEVLPEKVSVLKAYTRSAIESGESGKILGRINELREARRTLEAEKDDISEELATVLGGQVSDAIYSFAEAQSKELVDRLIEDIDSEIDAGGTKTTRTKTERPNPTGVKSAENKIAGVINRAEINGDDDAKVAVFPTKESGVPFLEENNAWGFVRVGSEFDYVAMYVTGDLRQVQYFAEVKDVVSPDEAELARPPEEYADGAKIAEDKVVIRFEPGKLYELADPVPFETKYPQGLRYTTLGALKLAETTDDML